MKERKKLASFVAYGGVATALGLVILYLSALIPAMELTFAAAAGVLLCIVVIKCSKGAALCVYCTVSLLGFLLVPNKGSVLLFIFFFGYYAILKAVAESCGNRLLEWVIKLCVFNGVTLLIFFFFQELVTFPPQIAGKLYFVLPLCNGVFVLFDLAFSGLIQLLIKRLP